jgi:hypothetical protein
MLTKRNKVLKIRNHSNKYFLLTAVIFLSVLVAIGCSSEATTTKEPALEQIDVDDTTFEGFSGDGLHFKENAIDQFNQALTQRKKTSTELDDELGSEFKEKYKVYTSLNHLALAFGEKPISIQDNKDEKIENLIKTLKKRIEELEPEESKQYAGVYNSESILYKAYMKEPFDIISTTIDMDNTDNPLSDFLDHIDEYEDDEIDQQISFSILSYATSNTLLDILTSDDLTFNNHQFEAYYEDINEIVSDMTHSLSGQLELLQSLKDGNGNSDIAGQTIGEVYDANENFDFGIRLLEGQLDEDEDTLY